MWSEIHPKRKIFAGQVKPDIFYCFVSGHILKLNMSQIHAVKKCTKNWKKFCFWNYESLGLGDYFPRSGIKNLIRKIALKNHK